MIVFSIFLILCTIAIFIVGITMKSNGVKAIAIVPLVALILANLIAGIQIIDSTEIGVVRTLGRITGTIHEGLNLVNPLVNKVTTYDLKIRAKEAEFMAYSRDAQPLSTQIEYQYQIQSDKVIEIAQDYGTYAALEEKLGNIIEEEVKRIFARYTAMELIENRSKLSSEVDAEVVNVEDHFNIIISSIIIRDIDFSDAFEQSVEQKMIAEQEALKAEQEKKKAIIKAEQDKEVAAINAEKTITQAKAEADALMITKEALEKMPANYVELQYLDKWDGHLPQIVGENSNLMITPELNK